MQKLTLKNKTVLIKVYDPFVTDNIIENQYHDLDQFLNDIDICNSDGSSVSIAF